MLNDTSKAELGEIRALVVDDNEHMRILLSTLLKAMDIRDVRECEDGAVALREIEGFHPDIVLTDYSMVPMDGLKFTLAIRHSADEKVRVTPVVMITGHTERHRVEAARDAGITEFLIKPVTAAGLFQRVEEIVLRPRIFVRSTDYFGPCRRRHNKKGYAGPWRRKDDAQSARPQAPGGNGAAAAGPA